MFENFVQAFSWVAGIFTSLSIVYGFYEKTVKKTVDGIHEEIKENTKLVKTLEEKHKEDIQEMSKKIEKNDQKLLHDNKSLLRQEEMNGIIMRSMSAVTHHLLDGTHSVQLEESAKEIDDYLFDKAKNIKE